MVEESSTFKALQFWWNRAKDLEAENKALRKELADGRD